MGGWTFEPWEGSFYPDDLPKKRQLEYASRQVTTIEINGTYYGSQKPATIAKWGAEAPDGFVFAVKGNRFVTNRKVLAEAGDSLNKFFAQELSGLGDKLGPILWQFAPTKKFDAGRFCRLSGFAATRGKRCAHPTRAGSPSPEFCRSGVRLACRRSWRRDRLCRSCDLPGHRGRDSGFRLCAPATGRRRDTDRLSRVGYAWTGRGAP
jgi:hypothetical protein